MEIIRVALSLIASSIAVNAILIVENQLCAKVHYSTDSPLSLPLVHSPPARIFSSPTTILDPASQRSTRSLHSPHFLLLSKRGNLFLCFFFCLRRLFFNLSSFFFSFTFLHTLLALLICALFPFHRPLIYIYHSNSTHTFSQCKVNLPSHSTFVTLQTPSLHHKTLTAASPLWNDYLQ